MLRIITLLLFTLVFFNTSQFAQNKDSLFRVANSNSVDSVRAKAFLELANVFYDTNPDSSIFLYNSCLDLLKDSSNKKLKYKILSDISFLYNNRSDYSKSKECLLQSLEIANNLQDSFLIAVSHSNLGNLYNQIELKEKAIFHLKEASNFINPSKKPNEAGKLYGRLGNFYLNNEYNTEAEASYQKAITYFKAANNLKGIIISTQNLGIIEKRRKNYDKAINYYNQALSSYESINYQIGVGQCLANIGNIYTEKGEYEKGLVNLNDALKLFKKNNQKIDEILCYAEIAQLYNEQKNYLKALETINKAKILLDSIPENDNTKIQVFFHLHTINRNIGDISSAYKYLLDYQSLSDTLSLRSSEFKLETLKIQYEVEQKDRDLELLTVENELKDAKLRRKSLFQIFYLITITLSAFAITSLIFLFRVKKKANTVLVLKNSEILQQKEEIEAQREEIEAQRDDLEIQRSIAIQQRDEIIRQKKSITDSIAYAKHIQTAMLPNEKEIVDVIPESFVFFKPLDVVSGDFYWVNNLKDQSVIAAADCTGHGVPGAFMSVMGINFLNAIVIEQGIIDPGEILTRLNHLVITALSHADTHLQDKDGMDISLCCIDWAKLTLYYSCARNRIIISRNGEIQQLEASKYSIGKSPFIEKIEFKTSKVSIQKGDMIYLMTDGYVDQFGGPERIKFLTSRFKKLIPEIAHLDVINQQKILDKTITDWQGTYPQIDDMLIVGVRI